MQMILYAGLFEPYELYLAAKCYIRCPKRSTWAVSLFFLYLQKSVQFFVLQQAAEILYVYKPVQK